MKGLHIRFEGLSASYPYPFLRTGTVLTLPVPPYSSILGMMSACAGRDILPNGFWLGYEFKSGERRTVDLETTHRMKTDKKGRLRQNPELGIGKREFHIFPSLDLYVSDRNLRAFFDIPVATPRFGRSQDLAWITQVAEIDLEPISEGVPCGTLLPYPDSPIGQVLPPLVDFYRNDVAGQLRVPGRISRYATLPQQNPVAVRETDKLKLFQPSNAVRQHQAIVMSNFE